VTNPLGDVLRRVINGAGVPVLYLDSLDRSFGIEYNATNRPIRIRDPLEGTTDFSYDGSGNLLTLTDSRNGLNQLRMMQSTAACRD
jgi:YD repeat-containing protein